MSDWGPRFGEGDKCVRHGEFACPSCLAYALGDLKAQNAALVEALERAADAIADNDAWHDVSRDDDGEVTCPQDDTCECPLPNAVNAALADTRAAAAAYVARIRAEMKERCAKVAEQPDGSGVSYDEAVMPIKRDIAAAIRALKE